MAVDILCPSAQEEIGDKHCDQHNPTAAVSMQSFLRTDSYHLHHVAPTVAVGHLDQLP